MCMVTSLSHINVHVCLSLLFFVRKRLIYECVCMYVLSLFLLAKDYYVNVHVFLFFLFLLTFCVCVCVLGKDYYTNVCVYVFIFSGFSLLDDNTSMFVYFMFFFVWKRWLLLLFLTPF